MKKISALLSALAAIAAMAPLGAHAVELHYYAGLGAGGVRVNEKLAPQYSTYAAYEYFGDTLVPVQDRTGSPAFGDPAYDPSKPFNPNWGKAASKVLDEFGGTDVGYRVFGGVRVGKYLGVEGGYVNLGKPEDDISLNVPPSSGPNVPLDIDPRGFVYLCNACRPETDTLLTLEDDFEGWELYVLGAYPITENFEVFAKAGAFFWESTSTAKNGFEQYPPSPPGSPETYVPTTTPASAKLDSDGTDAAGGLGFNYKVTERLTLRGEGTFYDVEGTSEVWLLGFNIILTY